MPKTCQHEGCTNPVFGGGYCKWHQRYREGKKGNRTTKTISNNMERESLLGLDRAFYMEIWESREHACYNCSRLLPREPLTLYFHHLLPKQHYPQFRHEEWNIAILCPDCHHGYETYPNPKKYEKIIELTNKLREEHG